MITLTYAPSWGEKFGREAAALSRVGEEEFRKTAQKINRRARAIGTGGLRRRMGSDAMTDGDRPHRGEI